MVWKIPQNQLFPGQISIIVPYKLLLGYLESIFKISTYAEKMAKNLDFQLNSLPSLPGKSQLVEIRENSACLLS